MESLLLLERLNRAVKDDIQSLQREADEAKKKSKWLEEENSNLNKSNQELVESYDSAKTKLCKLEEEIVHLNDKFKRKQEEMRRKDKWWDKYRFTAEVMLKKLRTLGTFPPGVLSELSRDLVDVMDETAASTSGSSQESEGKKTSKKLSITKAQKKVRYTDVSPENTATKSSQDQPHKEHFKSRKDDKACKKCIVDAAETGQIKPAKCGSSTSSAISSSHQRERQRKRSYNLSSTDVAIAKAVLHSQKNNPIRKVSVREEADVFDGDETCGYPDIGYPALTSTPMITEAAHKLPVPVMSLLDLSIILNDGNCGNNLGVQGRKPSNAGLPGSDSQLPVDLTNTQPPSPTVPSRVESVSREADSYETLWSPEKADEIRHRNKQSHEDESTALYVKTSVHRREEKPERTLQVDERSKFADIAVRDGVILKQSKSRAFPKRHSNRETLITERQSNEEADCARSKGAEITKWDTKNENETRENGTMNNQTKLASGKNAQDKAGDLDRVGRTTNTEVPSPSIFQGGPIKDKMPHNWCDESTISYPIPSREKTKANTEWITTNRETADEAKKQSSVQSGEGSAVKTVASTGRGWMQLQLSLEKLPNVNTSSVSGTKRKRKRSDDKGTSTSTKHKGLQGQKAPRAALTSSSSSEDGIFKVPEGPVRKQHDVICLEDSTECASVMLLSDGEEGGMETSSMDLFADSGAEPSKENRRVSDNGDILDNSNMYNEKHVGDSVKTSTTTSVQPSKDQHFGWKSDDVLDEADKCPIGRKPKELGYKNIEVVRKKEERAKLNGYSCRECKEYYGSLNLPEKELKQRLKACSRHRAKYSPPPSTPPGFWNLSFPDTEEYMKDGCLKTGSEVPLPRPRRLKNRRKRE